MAEMQKVVNTPAPPAGKLGKAELYALGLGQVIGVGVITLVGPMVAITGKSTWLAYLIAVILGFVSLLPYVFLTNTLRFGSGNSLGLALFDICTLVFCHKGQHLQHNIGEECTHQIFASAGV